MQYIWCDCFFSYFWHNTNLQVGKKLLDMETWLVVPEYSIMRKRSEHALLTTNHSLTLPSTGTKMERQLKISKFLVIAS